MHAPKLTVRSIAKVVVENYDRLVRAIRYVQEEGGPMPAGIQLREDHIEITERYPDWDDSDRWHEYTLLVWPTGMREVRFYSPDEGMQVLSDSEVPEGVLEDFKLMLDAALDTARELE